MVNDKLGIGNNGREEVVELSGEINGRDTGILASIAVRDVGQGSVGGITGYVGGTAVVEESCDGKVGCAEAGQMFRGVKAGFLGVGID